MILELEQEEYEIIDELLKNSNLHSLRYLINSRLNPVSPKNTKHNKSGAIKAAETYFSSSDVIIGDQVKWQDNGDALVLSWQIVPATYITEQDCGCGKK